MMMSWLRSMCLVSRWRVYSDQIFVKVVSTISSAKSEDTPIWVEAVNKSQLFWRHHSDSPSCFVASLPTWKCIEYLQSYSFVWKCRQIGTTMRGRRHIRSCRQIATENQQLETGKCSRLVEPETESKFWAPTNFVLTTMFVRTGFRIVVMFSSFVSPLVSFEQMKQSCPLEQLRRLNASQIQR